MKILTVAGFTLLRLRRSRYLLSGAILLAITLGIHWLSTARADIGSPGDVQWAQDFARFVGWLAAIWLGLGLVQADQADGALRSMLTRPISLPEVLFGKALGGFAALAAFALAADATVAVAAGLRGASVSWPMLAYLPATLPAQGMVLAATMLLAQALPRFAAGVAALLVRDEFFSDHALGTYARFLPESVMNVFAPFAHAAYWVMPPTSAYFVGYREFAAAEHDWLLAALTMPYAPLYAAAACLLAAALLSRREL